MSMSCSVAAPITRSFHRTREFSWTVAPTRPGAPVRTNSSTGPDAVGVTFGTALSSSAATSYSRSPRSALTSETNVAAPYTSNVWARAAPNGALTRWPLTGSGWADGLGTADAGTVGGVL